MRIDLDIAVEAEGWSAVAGLEALARRSVDAAVADLSDEAPAELSLLFCDDRAIQALNRQWRGKDKPTNVLSFPGAESPAPEAPRLLGDIAVALETTRREADHDGKPLADHVTHLIVHGVLHLLGHDHEVEAEAEAMEAAERRILARLGVPDPYAGADLAETGAP